MNITAQRYHDISCGHRVHGHEGKCQNLHGHNYRIHFGVQATVANREDTHTELDKVGRVLDFGVIKEKLCMWVEREWDHKFLIWIDDPIALPLRGLDPTGVIWVDFNPTAENMAQYLVENIGPKVLPEDVTLSEVTIEETAKCSVTYSLPTLFLLQEPGADLRKKYYEAGK